MPAEFELSASPSHHREIAEIIRRVGAEVMETMFFAEAVPVDECAAAWMADVSVRLGFEGSHSGQFLVQISRGVADDIAPAFLGLDPAETGPAERSQVMLELANILCGAMLSSAWPESNLTLSAPELVAADFQLPGAIHQCFEMPEGMLAVSLLLISGGLS